MWFKNIHVFVLKEKLDWTLESLEDQLGAARFLPCSSIEPKAEGWVAPGVEAEGPMVYCANNYWLLARKTEQKLIPASVLNEKLKEAVEIREAKESKKLRKKEKESLKDEIYHTLVTQAFSQSHVTFGYIDTQRNWVVVNASSRKKAEEFCSAIRTTLGSFKVEMPSLQSISGVMTEWLKAQQCPESLIIEDQCMIEDTKEGGSLKIAKQNLLADEILNFIDHGREVVQMRFGFRNEIAFSLKDDFSLKTLKFLEGVHDRASDLFTETAADRFDADFTLMTETLTELIGFLMKVFAIAEAGSEKSGEIKSGDIKQPELETA